MVEIQGAEAGPPTRRTLPSVAVIIVAFNCADLITDCLQSVINQERVARIVVIDNASEDQTVRAVRQLARSSPVPVICVPLQSNYGFGAACNLGSSLRGDADYLLFLNPDTHLPRPDAIGRCATHLESSPSVGVVGCRLIRSDGKLDHACKRNNPTFWSVLVQRTVLQRWINTDYTAPRVADNDIADVGAVNGAFLMIGACLYERVGGFNEAYFMYGEDLELCRRVIEAGKRVRYCGDVTVVHIKSATNNGKKPLFVKIEFARAMFVYQASFGATRGGRGLGKTLSRMLGWCSQRAGRPSLGPVPSSEATIG